MYAVNIGGYTTELVIQYTYTYIDFFLYLYLGIVISHEIRIPITQPGRLMECHGSRVLITAQLTEIDLLQV